MFEVGMKVNVMGENQKMRIKRISGRFVELQYGVRIIHRTTDQIWE